MIVIGERDYERAETNGKCGNYSNESTNDRAYEELVITAADAIVQIDAMVIEVSYAFITSFAMFGF